MEAGELRALVVSAFADEVRPRREVIAPHECAECDQLSKDFSDLDPFAFPNDCLEYHCWDLPLLSSAARRYFLPAWLMKSIDDPESEIADAIVINLGSDDSQKGYTGAQKAAILSFLSYLSERGDDIDREFIDRAEARWT